LVLKGTFAPGNGWQTIHFKTTQKGRYVAIEGLNAYDGKEQAAIAELYVLDEKGKRLSREAWTVKYADSEDADNGNKTADKTFDLQESTYWSTVAGERFPHVMVIDLGNEQQLSGLEYLPRAEEGAPASIKDYKIYVY
jgi:beta-galactosidase